jgi:hypothetical protein
MRSGRLALFGLYRLQLHRVLASLILKELLADYEHDRCKRKR